MIETLLAAASLGLFGSLHCTVMCGPLASAGCRSGRDTLGYVAGRLVTYVFAGSCFGALGWVAHSQSFHNAQMVLSFVAAAWVIVHGLSYFSKRDDRLVQLPATRSSPLPAFVRRLLPRRGVGLGLVTGLLPCGLLFAAWALAASTAHPVMGAAVMAVFAIVTLPALLAPTLMRPLVHRIAGRLPPAAIGALWALLGVWLAVRPLLHGHHGGH